MVGKEGRVARGRVKRRKDEKREGGEERVARGRVKGRKDGKREGGEERVARRRVKRRKDEKREENRSSRIAMRSSSRLTDRMGHTYPSSAAVSLLLQLHLSLPQYLLPSHLQKHLHLFLLLIREVVAVEDVDVVCWKLTNQLLLSVPLSRCSTNWSFVCRE